MAVTAAAAFRDPLIQDIIFLHILLQAVIEKNETNITKNGILITTIAINDNRIPITSIAINDDMLPFVLG